MRAAHAHHLPHSEFLAWDADDLAAEAALLARDAECCPNCGVHPSAWSRKFGGNPMDPSVVPEWDRCAICARIEAMREKGPPGGKKSPGWRIVLVPKDREEG